VSLLKPWRRRVVQRTLAQWKLGVVERADGWWLCNGFEAFGPFRSELAADRWGHNHLGCAPTWWGRLPIWIRTLALVSLFGLVATGAELLLCWFLLL